MVLWGWVGLESDLLLIFFSGEAILTSVLGLNASFVTGLILDFLLQFNGLVGVGWS